MYGVGVVYEYVCTKHAHRRVTCRTMYRQVNTIQQNQQQPSLKEKNMPMTEIKMTIMKQRSQSVGTIRDKRFKKRKENKNKNKRKTYSHEPI